MRPGLLWCLWQALGAITSTLGSHISLPLSQMACKIFSASLQEPGSCFKPGARSQWGTATPSPQMWGLKSLLQPPGGWKLFYLPWQASKHPLSLSAGTAFPRAALPSAAGLGGAARAVLIKSTLWGAVGHCGAQVPRMGRAGGETAAGREAEESRKSLVPVLWLKLRSGGVAKCQRDVRCCGQEHYLLQRQPVVWWRKGFCTTKRGTKVMAGVREFSCKEVADSGAPSCEDALYTDVQKMACRMPREGSLLQTACLTQVWEGHKGLSGRGGTWIPAQAFVCQMATYYLATNPTQSFQPLTIMEHTGTASKFCIQWHPLPGISWFLLGWFISRCFQKQWKGFGLHCEQIGRMWTGMVHSYLCCMLFMYASQEPCSGIIGL